MSHLQCLVLTFNCGREPVKPTVFARHISKALENGPKHDLIVLSLQEISPLSYGFIGGRCLSYYYKRIDEALQIAAGDYVSMYTENLGITATMIYVRRDLKDRIGSIDSGSVGLGWLEMGNKGAVGIKLSWMLPSRKYVDLTFIAAHLAPHEQGLERRNQDWMHIVQRLIFQRVWTSNAYLEALDEEGTSQPLTSANGPEEDHPLLGKDAISMPSGKSEAVQLSTIYTPMSYTFVAGDLNYRTSNNHPEPSDYTKYPKYSDSTELIDNLLKNDQLSLQRSESKTLHGFQEANIKFPPTYKYTSKSQKELVEKEDNDSLTKQQDDSPIPLNYATHRWPSWCDRILFLPPSIESTKRGTKVTNNFYKSLPLMSTSDHQPVVASFSILLEHLVSTEACKSTEFRDYCVDPPYTVDPHWKERFATARRRELMLGLLAYLGMTWEGNSILLAVFIGTAGLYWSFKF